MAETVEVKVPDIGDFDEVDVVEVLVKKGDRVAVDDSLITLESDKASMEVPSTSAGTVQEVLVSVGDKVGEGDVIVRLEKAEAAEEEGEEPAEEEKETAAAADTGEEEEPAEKAQKEREEKERAAKEREAEEPQAEEEQEKPAPPRERPPASKAAPGERPLVHASPSIRRFARELGVDLTQVQGSGRKGRIVKEDVQKFVKARLEQPPPAGAKALPPMPRVDWSKYGEIEERELGKIRRSSAQNVHRSWLHVPHVTQFDEADVTELEEFRQSLKDEARRRDVKLTPVAFQLIAAAKALREFPEVNSSLDESGEKLILKDYVHIGIAVDTPQGLVVPVLRDVDRKGVWELAEELGEISERARQGKLSINDLQGATFSISSLGGIGGTGFTPIVAAPQVAILGVARMDWKPVWRDGEFVPRRILPFSLSYDHRVIDGAQGVRFTTHLAGLLSDIRRLLL